MWTLNYDNGRGSSLCCQVEAVGECGDRSQHCRVIYSAARGRLSKCFGARLDADHLRDAREFTCYCWVVDRNKSAAPPPPPFTLTTPVGVVLWPWEVLLSPPAAFFNFPPHIRELLLYTQFQIRFLTVEQQITFWNIYSELNVSWDWR